MQYIKDLADFKFFLDSLEKEEDIRYYDGPLLTKFTSKVGGNIWLFSWAGANEWLIFELALDVFESYITRKQTLLQCLLNSPGPCFWADMDDNGYTVNFKKNMKKRRVFQRLTCRVRGHGALSCTLA